MPSKLTNALRGRNNFQRADLRKLEEPEISVAEAHGLKPPALTAAQRAGQNAIAAVAADRFDRDILGQEKYRQEKADYEKQRDDALWQKIQARRTI
ncbi:MAG: hypothetical protein ACHQC8_03485 [Solirubrobacterales bacterium]